MTPSRRSFVPAAAALLLGLGADAARACTLTRGPDRTVSRVLDGETLQLDDGSKVRLANVRAPRAADLGLETPLPSEPAAIAALAALAVGKAVRLDFDVARTDRHGTTRAHVRLRDGDEAGSLAVRLLAGGHVRMDARAGERGCLAPLLAAEDAARKAGLGVWAEPSQRVRAARPVRDLSAYRGTFQIVEGDVHAVEASRDLVRLLLGDDRRRHLTVSFRANDRDILGALGGDPRGLVGRRIEARGHLDTRPGSFAAPDIDVTLAGHVRLLP